MQVDREDSARERVEQELSELLDKITNLTKFLYGKGILQAHLSQRMTAYLRLQLDKMFEYAHWLQARLKIWGKTDAEIHAMENPGDKKEASAM